MSSHCCTRSHIGENPVDESVAAITVTALEGEAPLQMLKNDIIY